MSHTYAILELSPKSFREIKTKLEKAGYQDQFDDNDTIIDMHGLAVRAFTPSDYDIKPEGVRVEGKYYNVYVLSKKGKRLGTYLLESDAEKALEDLTYDWDADAANEQTASRKSFC